jgi:HEPN domain-containing protein
VEKADYSYALFFGHLAIEKLLKALCAVRVQQHAPPIHNLIRLARGVGLELNEARTGALITITAFNIETRYPDIKRAFRQKCTPEYTDEQMRLIKELFEWL